MVCGLKQCSGSNISRKQHEMRLIFKLGTLQPNGLNINFNFLWPAGLARITLTRAKTVVFLFVSYKSALSVRAYAYKFLDCVPKSTYWRRPKPETFGLFEQIITFHSILALYTTFFTVSHAHELFAQSFWIWAKRYSKTGFSIKDLKSSKTLRRLRRNSRCTLISGWGELFSK